MSASPLFDDHASLPASLEDFEDEEQRSPPFGLPSQHSGFKSSDESDSEEEEVVSEEPWSPPAWRQNNAAGGWYTHQPYPQDNQVLKPSRSPSHSRTSSPIYESAHEDDEEEDTTMAANIPLPRGSVSPVKEQSPEKQASPVKERSPSKSPYPEADQDFGNKFGESEVAVPVPENPNNCLPPLYHEEKALLIRSKTFDSLYEQKYSSGPNQSKPHYCG